MSKETVARIKELRIQIRRAFDEGKIIEALDLDRGLGMLIRTGK
jgi:hypothetical protein